MHPQTKNIKTKNTTRTNPDTKVLIATKQTQNETETETMTKEEPILTIIKPHFTVKLHPSLLEVDLNKGVKKELEDAIESAGLVRDSVGLLFQTVVPLDVQLKDIETAKTNKQGHVKITIPHRRDITIPLEPEESQKLLEQMSELIPKEKEKAARQLLESKQARKALEVRLAQTGAAREAAERIR